MGKLAGLNSDTNNNKIKEFLSFMNANPLKYSYEQDGWGNPMGDSLSIWNYMNRAKNLGDEYNKLINSNMNLEEFKTKYLDFRQRHDEFVKSLEEAEKAEGIDYDKSPTEESANSEEGEENGMKNNKEKKTFKPIQAESKSETYKEEINSNFWEQFVKIQREKGVDVLGLLERLSNKGLDIKA